MKKLLVVTLAAILLVSISSLAFANSLTLQAENGKVLDPAGLEIDAVGLASLENSYSLTNYQLQIGYGISRLITITGNLERDQDYQRLMARALYSPSPSNTGGYTIYGGYDINNEQLAEYGLTLWTNWKMLMAFINLESDLDQNNERFYEVSPGVNLRIAPNIKIAGEVRLTPEDWSIQTITAGINYSLNKKVSAKLYVVEGINNQKGRVFNTGLSVQL